MPRLRRSASFLTLRQSTQQLVIRNIGRHGFTAENCNLEEMRELIAERLHFEDYYLIRQQKNMAMLSYFLIACGVISEIISLSVAGTRYIKATTAESSAKESGFLELIVPGLAIMAVGILVLKTPCHCLQRNINTRIEDSIINLCLNQQVPLALGPTQRRAGSTLTFMHRTQQRVTRATHASSQVAPESEDESMSEARPRFSS